MKCGVLLLHKLCLANWYFWLVIWSKLIYVIFFLIHDAINNEFWNDKQFAQCGYHAYGCKANMDCNDAYFTSIGIQKSELKCS